MKSYDFNFRLKTLNIDMSHSHLNGFGHMGYLDTIGSVCPDLTQLTVGYHSPSSSYDTKTALGLESGVVTGASFAGQHLKIWCPVTTSLVLDRRSIDLSGAQEKEGHFHYKNFLRASK